MLLNRQIHQNTAIRQQESPGDVTGIRSVKAYVYYLFITMIVAVIILIIHGSSKNLCPSILRQWEILKWNPEVPVLYSRLEAIEASSSSWEP